MTEYKKTAALDWEDVRCFSALARYGSVGATARALDVTDETVTRRIANLEATLDCELFTRGARGFTLSAAGATALAEAAQMEMAACALVQTHAVHSRTPGSTSAGPRGRGSSAPTVSDKVRGRQKT
jgi:DNA-binding transcriptional LysR family regulator